MTFMYENLPYRLNNQYRDYLVGNFKKLNAERNFIRQLFNKHQMSNEVVHKSTQITHKGQTISQFLNVLEGRVDNQIYGASRNSTAEVKDIRVDTEGTIHDLAQNRLMFDFNKIDAIASQADDLAQKHDGQIKESAYYNEISYINGRKNDTTYKIVYIPHRDNDGNIIKLRKGISGNDPANPEHITARQFAKNTGATYVSNASTGSTSRKKLHGQQIYNGEVIDSIKEDEYEPIKDRWTLAIADDNAMTAFPQHITAQEIKNKGYNTTFSGFGPLIMDGKVVYKEGDYSTNSNERHPRQIIAQLPNKDVVVFSCDGRVVAQALLQRGMTLTEAIDTLYDHFGEIQFAYNLDGGGSTSSVLRSRMLNKVTDNHNKSERKLLDFLYVGKDPRQVRDTDIQKAYEDIGDLRENFQFLYGLLMGWNEINSNELRLMDYSQYTGIVAMDGQDNPKKKIYLQPNEFRFWDYDTSRTWFRVTEDSMQLHNRELARQFSAPESVTDCNSIKTGGTYHVPKTAKGSPYPGQSSAIVEQFNITYAELSEGATAIQKATPFARSANYKQKRRTFAEGKWSQWFDV
ncbi:phosphodiester glycosidase family protein [Staphylococcus pettenkoferi]|uniref:phosphodiester glycosidase family protein n=1 Tax=Staphylococcus pettenkoferi TaxID=170573 RepID=UPI002273D9A5|nr:phosphodiester glycosidase family protein [Staphylococcus pettenkoferi]MCY1589844.1 phosphodiester glycosidase family protein [Staphylococcus pettenkoferi]MCY1599234.1 phosphodiester glycosidase family protein [Staphylococcus pettenkoferi]MCY1613792.1 phosphodiester glycosidase family protein [Staphylococcus pettenkoferi]